MEQTFQLLPKNLNASVIVENEKFGVLILKGVEMWSFVGSSKNVSGYGFSCIQQHAKS
ncbi:hypothetical protein [Candidatus Protochlamydia amoebophila]|uniref:hypothetical protein n=1 Tax=Candidatus Protochlamydia amoebophila TaxID=362787 RepID=UPI000317F8AF|nr:hypothetical protein [Candidatus Protochlamydia amoebophila]